MELLRDEYRNEALSFFDTTNIADNIDFWKETHETDSDKLTDIREQNAKAIKDLFLDANSMPTNLRYCDGSSNGGIKENLDSMGDKNGIVTIHENEMISMYHGTMNIKPEKFGDQYYLRSGSGKHKPSANTKKWYIKCLNNNDKCC